MSDVSATFPPVTQQYAERINACWRKSAQAFMEAGDILIEAKDALPHGEFQDMIETKLLFRPRTAQRLMAIARDERLRNASIVSLLPPSWGTLYEITRLSDEELYPRVADGTIHPDMERGDIAIVVKQGKRREIEAEIGAKIAALPTKRYGVIVADPPWRFEPYSRVTGMDRAPENHYPTMTLDEIAALPIADVRAPDCVLFLWATAPMLPQALEVMTSWGFTYKSHGVWAKVEPGTGYWLRAQHELFLIGTCGNVPAPAPGMQRNSVLRPKHDPPRHSQKPEYFFQLVEAYYPTMPKIELYARTLREGWDSWGLEVPKDEIG